MSIGILIGKIVSLFIVLFLGFLLVKCGICKVNDSRVLSRLCIYLVVPCSILSAFQVSYTPAIRSGLLLAVGAAILVHIVLIGLFTILGPILHLNGIEKASIIYSNAGNLVIPLGSSILGADWGIYSSAYVSVQLFLLWSHWKMMICGETKPDLKKIFTNVNMITILFGVLLFAAQISLPGPVDSAVRSLGAMIGPLAMLIAGMLIAGTTPKEVLSYPHIALVTLLRLVGVPLLTILLLKFSGLSSLAENGRQILLVTLLATITPSASTITQMAQVYGKDARYAGAINVITTLLCMISMPIMVYLYQL